MTDNTENSFPFNQHAPDMFKEELVESMIAVINGLQQNIRLLAHKIEVVEHRLNELEKENEQIRGIQQERLPF